VEVCVVAEELGRGLADAAFLGPTLAADLRRLSGCPPASGGETLLVTPGLGSVALAAGGEPPAGSVALDAAGASAALLLEAAGTGWSLARVALGEPTTRVDLTRPMALPAPGASVEPLGGATIGAEQLDRVVALGLAAASADLVGTMAGAVVLATTYATDRHQYGRPVGSFQAVQHLLADAHAMTEGSRSLSLHAAWGVDALVPQQARVAAATAKAYAARSSRTVCETVIQVHGGIGNTWECLAHLHLRRALLSADLLGGIDACLETVLEDRLGALAEVAGEHRCHTGGADGLR
jgi:hypothetical protein